MCRMIHSFFCLLAFFEPPGKVPIPHPLELEGLSLQHEKWSKTRGAFGEVRIHGCVTWHSLACRTVTASLKLLYLICFSGKSRLIAIKKVSEFAFNTAI